jgi:hypothetical protein
VDPSTLSGLLSNRAQLPTAQLLKSSATATSTSYLLNYNTAKTQIDTTGSIKRCYKHINRYLRDSTPTPMDQKDEYNYFKIFVRQTIPKTCPLTPINFLHLQSMVMDMLHIVLTKSHDKDAIRWKCGDILAMLFSISGEMPNIEPCQDSTHYRKEPGELRDSYTLTQEMIQTNKELILYFVKSTMCYWDPGFFETLQTLIYDFVTKLWEISDLNDLHELMSLKIQMFCHYHIRNERVAQSLAKPFMKYRYEALSIHPLKYYWNPESKELLQFINSVNNIQLGVEHYLDEYLRSLYSAIKYKIHDLKIEPSAVLNELGLLLNCHVDDLDLDDSKTLLWPLLYHVYTRTFDEIWQSKHWFPRTPMTIRRQAVLSTAAAATTAEENSTTSRLYAKKSAPPPTASETSDPVNRKRHHGENNSSSVPQSASENDEYMSAPNFLARQSLKLNLPAIDIAMNHNWKPFDPADSIQSKMETFYNAMDSDT